MLKKVKFIYNPHSGENIILSELDYIISQYQKSGYQIIPFRLTFDTALEDAFEDVDCSYEQILIAGGDGTVNAVVNYIMRNNITIPIAVLPAGTANDFSKLLGFNSSIKKSVKDVLNGKVSEIDIGEVDGTYFINVLSAGLFTDVSQKTPTKLKNTFGKLAYYFSTISELPSFKKINLCITSKEFNFDDEALIFFVFNGRTAGNLPFAYKSDIQDGFFDVIIIKGDNIANTITAAFHFFTRNNGEYPKGVVHFRTDQLCISSKDILSVDIDGEHGPELPISINCLKKSIKVISKKGSK